jgi:hypothetical protein
VRARAAVAAALLAAVLGWGAAPAHASSQPTLLETLQRVDLLKQQLNVAHGRLAAAHLDVLRSAGLLERASERVARVGTQDGVYRYARGVRTSGRERSRPRLILRPAYVSALRALHRAQRAAAAGDAFPRIAHAQRTIDRLTAERRRERALADVLGGRVVPAASGEEQSRESWAVSLLQALDAPVCSNNLVTLVTWQTAENTDAAWNPLATTMPAAGASAYNAVGVKNYASADDGIRATVDTLQQGWDSQGYGWIVYRLGTCADPVVTARAIRASNWCHGCAGGAYVTGMVDVVRSDYAGFAGG